MRTFLSIFLIAIFSALAVGCDEVERKGKSCYVMVEEITYIPSQKAVLPDTFELVDRITPDEFLEIRDFLYDEANDWRVKGQVRWNDRGFKQLDAFVFALNGWEVDLLMPITIQRFDDICKKEDQNAFEIPESTPPTEGEDIPPTAQ